MSEPMTEAVRQLRERHYRVVPTDPKILHPYCPGCLQDWDPEGCDTARALALLDAARADAKRLAPFANHRGHCAHLQRPPFRQADANPCDCGLGAALAVHREAQPERSKNDA